MTEPDRREELDRVEVLAAGGAVTCPVASGSFAPDDEVDEVRWLALDDARRILGYGHDGVVLDALTSLLR